MSHVLIFSHLSFKLKFNLHRWFLFTFDTINFYVPFLIYKTDKIKRYIVCFGGSEILSKFR
jgi:hypothetical protein